MTSPNDSPLSASASDPLATVASTPEARVLDAAPPGTPRPSPTESEVPPSIAVDRELARLAVVLVGRILAHYQARAAELSLSMPEAKALGSLEPERPLSMRELAARIHASPSNLTVTVNGLEARGLIARRGGDDRRVKGVMLTEAGLALKQRLDARLMADHPASYSLDASQRATLLDLLRVLAGQPEAAGGA